jgi:hypothetical protein
LAIRAYDRIGRYAFVAYVVFLIATYLSVLFGNNVPHSVNAEIAWPGLIVGPLMLLWAWWFDLHRAKVTTQPVLEGFS